jgi:hypothetical protein
MQQSLALGDIAYVGCGGNDGVHQAGISIDANMGLHPEVPLLPFLV